MVGLKRIDIYFGGNMEIKNTLKVTVIIGNECRSIEVSNVPSSKNLPELIREAVAQCLYSVDKDAQYLRDQLRWFNIAFSAIKESLTPNQAGIFWQTYEKESSRKT